MNTLELATLKRYCDKYGLDYYEIDNTLTFWENKKHLRSLVHMLSQSLDVSELARMDELRKQYVAEHFLSYYVMCQLAGETVSAEVGTPSEEPSFSLQAFIQRGRNVHGRHH